MQCCFDHCLTGINSEKVGVGHDDEVPYLRRKSAIASNTNRAEVLFVPVVSPP
jgi:hypothetical protein